MCKNKRKKNEAESILIIDDIVRERKEKIENKIQQIRNLQAQVDEELKELKYFLEKKEVADQ